MSDWNPSFEYQRVAEANRRFYARFATLYERSETCVADRQVQRRLEADLDRIIALSGQPATALRALDACGGSGNVSLKLLNRGVNVTLVDISPELLEIFRSKCAAAGMTPRMVCAEIGSFLSDTTESFDLIVFSSALHHLENIEQILTLTFHRLRPGGLLYTIYDPTDRGKLKPTTRALQRVEYFAFKLFCQPGDLPAAVGRRLRRVFSGASTRRKSNAALNHATAGMLAEFHVERGIDDLALAAKLRAVGFEVVWHERYADSRFAITRRIIERIGDPTSFKFLLRRPASGST
jgi:2-polyprenyl-3-methyl-5-hydroxy-6-metoxy-1,4-benzoquinol methylase